MLHNITWKQPKCMYVILDDTALEKVRFPLVFLIITYDRFPQENKLSLKHRSFPINHFPCKVFINADKSIWKYVKHGGKTIFGRFPWVPEAFVTKWSSHVPMVTRNMCQQAVLTGCYGNESRFLSENCYMQIYCILSRGVPVQSHYCIIYYTITQTELTILCTGKYSFGFSADLLTVMYFNMVIAAEVEKDQAFNIKLL